jgi:hypothetical protein
MGMQNPGDLLVPEGVVIRSRKKVLILRSNTVLLTPRDEFDEVVPLAGDGVGATAEEEQIELSLTTRR